MMYVKSINWLSKEAKEAELIISDGKYECLAFSHPCYFNIGSPLKSPLFAVSCKNIMRSDEENFSIVQIEAGKFQHRIIGKLVDYKKELIQIGGLQIIIKFIPKDLKEGEFVEFFCARLDVID